MTTLYDPDWGLKSQLNRDWEPNLLKNKGILKNIERQKVRCLCRLSVGFFIFNP